MEQTKGKLNKVVRADEVWVNGSQAAARVWCFQIDYRFRFFFGGCVTAQSGQYHLTLLGGALRMRTHS